MATFRYDVFLSHSSADKPAVEELARRLRHKGLTPFYDDWEIIPGRMSQPVLAKALRDSKTCAVFLGPNVLGPWHNEEIQVALDRRARDPQFHVIPVLLPGTERPRRGDVAHLEFLINASWVEFLKGLDDEWAFGKLVCGIKGIKPGSTHDKAADERQCPYRGLRAFGPEDAKFFFGRENLTDWLVSDLRREIRDTVGVRFLAVLGPSGSGKSSVVLAGLIPRLKEGATDGSERWLIAIVRPGDDPLKELGTAVAAQFVPAGSLPDARQALQFSDDMLSDERMLDAFACMALNAGPAEARLLVVVDQFEEAFTYRPEDEKKKEAFAECRDAFFANLLHAAAAPGGRVAVVLTMRSDFLGPCASFERLNNVLNAHLIQVGPMREDELRAAIELPAFKVSCELEPGLTERLLADVEGQAGALPLLQFTLDELWQRREVRRLTLRAYTEQGGVEGALERRANETLQKLSQADQDLCRRIFLHLVQPGEGTEDTMRRASFDELIASEAERATVEEVVHKLADARLITTEGREGTARAGAQAVEAEGSEHPAGLPGERQPPRYVEVAHEALIRGWPQLRRWIDADRAGLRLHRQLTEAAREWERHDGDASFLFQGTRLAVAREWAEAPPKKKLNLRDRAFLEASVQQEQKRQSDKKADAERLVKEQRRRIWTLRGLLVMALALMVILFWALVHAETEWANQMRLAKANGYREDVYSLMGVKIPPKQIHLAGANGNHESSYSFSLIKRKIWRMLFGMTFAISPAKLQEVVVGCMGDFSGFRPVSIDLDDRKKPVLDPTMFDPTTFKTVAVHPEVGQYAIGMADGTIAVLGYQNDSRSSLYRDCRPCPGKNRAALTTTGRQLICAGCNGTIWVWESGGQGPPKGARGASLDLGDDDHLCAAITPNGKYLAVGKRNSSTIWMCDLLVPEPRFENPKCLPGRQLTCLAFDARDNCLRLAAGYREGTKHYVSIWRVDDSKGPLGTEEGVVESHSGEVRGAAFSPNGKFLAVCSEGIAVFEILDRPVSRWPKVLARLPLAKWLIDELSKRYDWRPKVLAHKDYRPYFTLGGDQSDFPEFSPDSQLLAYTCAQRQEVRLWSVSTRRRVAILEHQGPVQAAMFRRDGRELVVTGPQSIRLWDLACAVEKTTLAGHTQGVPGVAFSPDGKWLVSVSKDGTVRVWDPVEGVPLKLLRREMKDNVLTTLKGYGQTVAFSPNGKLLAIGDWAGAIQIWDVSAERIEGWWCLGPVPIKGSPNEKIWTVGFSWDGRYFAAGGEFGLRLWRVANRRLNEVPLPKDVPPLVKGLWFGEGGQMAWAGAESKEQDAPIHLYLWDFKKNPKQLCWDFKKNPKQPCSSQLDDGVLSVAFVPGEEKNQLIFVDHDGSIRIIDENGQDKSPSPIQRKKEAGGSVLSLSPHGDWLAVQSGLAAEVWDIHTRKLLYSLPEELGIVWSLSWNPDKSRWNGGEKQLAGFDLRLMSSLNDVSGIPTKGKNLIIVAAVNNVLHFRIFDGDGKEVVDTDEKRLAEQTRQIEDLRKQLESLWPPHEMTGSDKGRVVTAVTSIVGHTQLAVGTSDGGLFLWDIGKVRAELDRMRLGW